MSVKSGTFTITVTGECAESVSYELNKHIMPSCATRAIITGSIAHYDDDFAGAVPYTDIDYDVEFLYLKGASAQEIEEEQCIENIGMLLTEYSDKLLDVAVEDGEVDMCDLVGVCENSEGGLSEVLTNDILERYDNVEYWDPYIVETYLAEADCISEKDKEIAEMVIGEVALEEAIEARNGAYDE